jgi:hypothetical protein
MAWILHDDKDKAIIAEITEQSDRGAIVVAGSLLERQLEKLIKSRLDTTNANEAAAFMFGRSGPLATFFAKIEMGWLLQFYPSLIRDLLHVIRDLRNDAAHETEAISFDNNDSIKSRCANAHGKLGDIVWSGMEHEFHLSSKIAQKIGRLSEQGKLRVLYDNGWEADFYSLRGDPEKTKDKFLALIKAALYHFHQVENIFVALKVDLLPPSSPDKPAPPSGKRAHGPNDGRKRRKRQPQSSQA